MKPVYFADCPTCRRASSGVCKEHRKTTCRYCERPFYPPIPGQRACGKCKRALMNERKPYVKHERV